MTRRPAKRPVKRPAKPPAKRGTKRPASGAVVRGRGGRDGDEPNGDEPKGGDRFPIPPELVEHILLGPTDDRRVLQDSPVLGDVWLAYAADPAGRTDLLITPHRDRTPGRVAARITLGRTTMAKRKGESGLSQSKIAYLQGIVAAELTFEEMLVVLVPLTQWWSARDEQTKAELASRQEFWDKIRNLLAPDEFWRAKRRLQGSQEVAGSEPFTSLQRYVALAGLILWVGRQKQPDGVGADDRPSPIGVDEALRRYEHSIPDIVDGIRGIYRDIAADTAVIAAKTPPDRLAVEECKTALIFQISLNRRASFALDRSVPSVKGDAASNLFKVDCSKIVWAVLDSGIQGDHPAFARPDDKGHLKSRVRRTFDFTRIRDLLSSGNSSLDRDAIATATGLATGDIDARLRAIAADVDDGRPTDWDKVEDLITLKSWSQPKKDRPPRPTNRHGTHVAGIIGGRTGEDDPGHEPGGMCPDIGLYDFRVLSKSLAETEFAIMAALQYIRYLNERQSYVIVHGANLSLSIPHSVRNYACGRTPICVECERLVDAGVVVVAAAGNRGYQNFRTDEGTFESYAAFSITDPGNGDGVVTVGATHGSWPHTYGVSFFSSRGPTGDGRIKPDLVAPGEKIRSAVLDDEWGTESGTSMAAPHVSGAAAMLLARYPELVGQPRRVKRLLCENATDLGRERTFQGAGMLDVLRAFQAI
jgi:subtilisin family serine protease